MDNEMKLNKIVLAESKAAGTEEEPIIDHIIPVYTDEKGKLHYALIETVLSCIKDEDGNRLDRIIKDLQESIKSLGGVMLLLLN